MQIDLPQKNDAPRIAQIHIQAWQEAYRGLIPDQLLDNLSLERREGWWRQQLDQPSSEELRVIRDRKGEIVGFTSFGPNRDEDLAETVGELYTLYLLKKYWGQGYGRELLTAALEGLQQRGYGHISLWVLHNNERGINFYRKAGFVPDGAEKTLEAAGVALREVRVRRPLERSSEKGVQSAT